VDVVNIIADVLALVVEIEVVVELGETAVEL